MNNYNEHFDLGRLIAKHVQGELTDQEKTELEQWLQADVRNHELFKKITDEQAINHELEVFSATDKSAAWQNIVKSTGYKPKTNKKKLDSIRCRGNTANGFRNYTDT
jgi:transmembrane sensor